MKEYLQYIRHPVESLITLWQWMLAPAEERRAKDDTISAMLAESISPKASKVVFLLIMGAFGVLLLRLWYLQLGPNTEFLQKQGAIRFQRTLDAPAMRGKILDRNGYVLASSVPAKAVWAIPQDVVITAEQKKALAKLLNMPQKDLDAKLASKKSFMYLKRQVPMDDASQIADMKIPGIHFSREYLRQYPDGTIAAQITGLTGIDGNGVEGVELADEKKLAGKIGSRRVLKDRLGRIVEDAWIKPPQNGEDIVLSIDSRIQYIAYTALEKRIKEVGAKAGAVIVVDPHTGDILALANYPSYDPNARTKFDPTNIRNRAITDTYEPGSTMKPFSVSAGLEEKKVNPNTLFQIGKSLQIGKASIGDSHYSKELTVSQIIQQSSNIGTAKVALMMTPHTMWTYYDSLGFGHAPNIGFPGAAAGRLRPAKTWKPIEQATMSYGHGVTVSLMQLVRAYTALARDGDLIDLSIYKEEEPRESKRIYSSNTAAQMKKMLESVVEKGAKRAQIEGYTAAGKTGTAYKVEGGLYVKKYVASFTGYAPAASPRLIVGVMIDEPQTGKHFGAVAAAPVFSEVAGKSLRLLAVSPDRPVEAKKGADTRLAGPAKKPKEAAKTAKAAKPESSGTTRSAAVKNRNGEQARAATDKDKKNG
jgi:cell division protein FtsI (penicillin-binding protein 3)